MECTNRQRNARSCKRRKSFSAAARGGRTDKIRFSLISIVARETRRHFNAWEAQFSSATPTLWTIQPACQNRTDGQLWSVGRSVSLFGTMAPIEPDLHNSNVRPLSIFARYLILASGLSGLISYDVLRRAFRSLPPSQDTRHRQSNHEKHVQLFAILALLSLAVTWYHMLQYVALSYRAWAYEMDEPLPATPCGENGYFAFGTLRLALGRWLKDTSLFRDV